MRLALSSEIDSRCFLQDPQLEELSQNLGEHGFLEASKADFLREQGVAAHFLHNQTA